MWSEFYAARIKRNISLQVWYEALISRNDALLKVKEVNGTAAMEEALQQLALKETTLLEKAAERDQDLAVFKRIGFHFPRDA